MANPIEYSDFIKPDDSITNLIKQLEALIATQATLHKQLQDDAKQTEASVKRVSAATQEGQETIQRATQDTDKLTQANKKLEESRTANAQELARLKELQREQNNINKLTAKLNKAAEGSYDKLSAQYSLNKIKLNAMSKAEREGSEAGKALEKETLALRNEMVRLQEATGNHTLKVGRYKDALEGLPGPIGNAVSGFQALSAKLLALLKNPIILLLAGIATALSLIYKAMGRSEEGQDRLNKIMTIGAAIFDDVMDILTLLGVALFDTIPSALKLAGNQFLLFSQRVKRAVLAVKITWNDLLNDVEDSDEARASLEASAKATEKLKVENEELAKVVSQGFDEVTEKAKGFGDELERDITKATKLAALQSKFNKDERKFIVENAKLTSQSAKARGEAEALKLIDAKASIEVLKESFKLDEAVLKNELKLAKQRKQILLTTSSLAVDDIEAKKGIAEAEAKVFDIETKFDNLRRQRVRRLNQLRKEALKQNRERSKTQLQLSQLEQAEEIRANKTIIQSAETTYEAKREALIANATFALNEIKKATSLEIEELEGRKNLKLISDKDYALQKLLIEKKLTNDQKKIAEKLVAEQDKVDASERKRDKDKYNAATKAFKIEQDLAESEIDLLKVTEAEKTKLKLEAEKERLQKILELNKKAGGQLSQEQLKITENSIKAIDQKLNEKGETAKDIYEAVGLKLSEDEKGVISDSTAFAIEQVEEFAQKKVDSSQAAVEASNDEVQAANTALQTELMNREKGYASNVSQAQKELDLARKTQEAALRDQEKARKQQAAIQTLQQIGSLVTGAAKIWGQLGFPWAIPAIAVMFGSFALSKVKAAKEAVTYGDGGLEFLQGGSHNSGNDINIGTTRGGRPRRAEGGEAMAIINKRSTSKYKSSLPSIIDSLNKGVFDETFNTSNTYNVHNGSGLDVSNIEKNVANIAKNNKRKVVPDGKGGFLEVYKNVKTRVR